MKLEIKKVFSIQLQYC